MGPEALKPLNPLCVPLHFDDDDTADNVCEVSIQLEEAWEGPVYVFYTLTNFYQNHRLYVADRADNQLAVRALHLLLSNSFFVSQQLSSLRGAGDKLTRVRHTLHRPAWGAAIPGLLVRVAARGAVLHGHGQLCVAACLL